MNSKILLPDDLRRLPLAALRAFECVGRHGHLGRAGEELGVTHSAVSHQIRNLEDLLGATLFDRSQKQLRLSPAGRALHQAVSDGFARMLSGVRNVHTDALAGPLTIGCTQTIGACWALKIICAFQDAHPEIEIAVREIAPKQKTIPTEIDLAICYGAPNQDNRIITPLAAPTLYPVCSPRLLSSAARLTRPQALGKFRLIDDRQNSWRRWFEAHNATYPQEPKLFRVNNTYLALSAARMGFGAALGNELETAEDLREGRLINMLNAPLEEAERYYLAARSPDLSSPRAALFEKWLLAETPGL